MKKPTFLKLFLLIGLTLSAMAVMSQESAVQLRNSNFEGSSLKPWIVIGNGAMLSKSNAHAGNQALELGSGTIIQADVKLKPSSSYKLSGWLKTESGSNEVRLGVNGLGQHNTETASALANWKKVELKFATGSEQSTAIIEIQIRRTKRKTGPGPMILILNTWANLLQQKRQASNNLPQESRKPTWVFRSSLTPK